LHNNIFFGTQTTQISANFIPIAIGRIIFSDLRFLCNLRSKYGAQIKIRSILKYVFLSALSAKIRVPFLFLVYPG